MMQRFPYLYLLPSKDTVSSSGNPMRQQGAVCLWWLVTHKQMTVLYTTDRYLAGHTEERCVCVGTEIGGAKDIVCVFVWQNYDGRDRRADVDLTGKRQSRKRCLKAVHTSRHLGHSLDGNMDKRRKDRDLTERPICFFSVPTVFGTGQASQFICFDIVQQELSGQAKLVSFCDSPASFNPPSVHYRLLTKM